ncbi:type 1 glutamine amidotransferase [Streptomyces sp. NPDC060194]|uniref:type 1 glutamine amidotransferase n=1 Tax=Streptomyces sp. NPDC060194 TaxID=3347069 RepID=UPI0036516084
MITVLVVQNTVRGGPGRLAGWWEEEGLAVEVVRPYAGEALPGRLAGRPLVVMGGGFMPDDDGRAPWLAPVRRLVGEAVAEGTPMLGICLGGQLLAQVAGGTVRARHGTPEYGSVALRLRPECAQDPLFAGLGTAVTAVERHVDAITVLPPGAVWLADNEACPYQAFRVGPRAWGLQFHPEATAADVAAWDRDRLAALGLDPAALTARATAHAPRATPVWSTLTRRFAAVCDPGR